MNKLLRHQYQAAVGAEALRLAFEDLKLRFPKVNLQMVETPFEYNFRVTFKVLGVDMMAKATSRDQVIEIEMKVPWLFLRWVDLANAFIAREADQYIERAAKQMIVWTASGSIQKREDVVTQDNQ